MPTKVINLPNKHTIVKARKSFIRQYYCWRGIMVFLTRQTIISILQDLQDNETCFRDQWWTMHVLKKIIYFIYDIGGDTTISDAGLAKAIKKLSGNRLENGCHEGKIRWRQADKERKKSTCIRRELLFVSLSYMRRHLLFQLIWTKQERLSEQLNQQTLRADLIASSLAHNNNNSAKSIWKLLVSETKTLR